MSSFKGVIDNKCKDFDINVIPFLAIQILRSRIHLGILLFGSTLGQLDY